MSSEQPVNMNLNNEFIQRCGNCLTERHPCDSCRLHKLMTDLEQLIPNAVNNVIEIENILLKIGEIRDLSKESLLGLFAFMVMTSTGCDIPNLFGLRQEIDLKIVEDNHITEKVEECVICYEVKQRNSFAILNCEHVFCGDCVVKTIEATRSQNEENDYSINHVKCSLCRENISVISVVDDKFVYNNVKEALSNLKDE